jgi:nitrous oxidase accessory protein NosD
VGGAPNPAVRVENSSIRLFDSIGIWTQTNAAASELTVTISGNDVNGGFGAGVIANSDIAMGPGATTTVRDNYLAGGVTGVIAAATANGSISGNTLITDGTAIAINGDGVSISGNDIFLSSTEGISVNSALPVVQHNTITGCPIGIELNGFADGNVHSNTIMDGGVGLDEVPAGLTVSNSYYNVGTIIRKAGGGVR